MLLIELLLFTALAQNAPHIREWRAPSGESKMSPKASCSGLRSLTGYEFTVVIAEETTPRRGGEPFCRVMGQVRPEIQFEVALPRAWNSRLYMFGNGGYAGESLDTPGRQSRRDEAARLGFVVTSTNTGHDAAREPLGTFATDSQKLYDYAFRSLHVTAVTAKKIAEAYYGSGPRKSYFDGCSTGGRQGLILAQRFPGDFDGIVVGAPVLNFTGTILRGVASARALSAAPFSIAKVQLLARHIYEHCDAKDGLKDGLIDDPRRCGFVPSSHLPACSGAESADCFTREQIRALEAFYGGVMSQGKAIFPGWPVGAEVNGPNGLPGWDGWFVSAKMPQPIGAMFAETFLRYFAFPKKDPNYTIDKFDMEKDPAKLEWISKVVDATDPDLSAFRDRGGRILMYYGWADQALNARMGVDYYESVLKRMGPSAKEFFRLYMMPGVFHCGGGVGPASFDALSPLSSWVEQSKAPDALIASQVENAKIVRTRPLCPYPQVARHKGTGSPDDAANFSCVAPPAN